MSGFSDVLGSIGKGIASFAPTLATMLGGPLAGTAVTAIEGALGLSSDPQADLGTRAQAIAGLLQNAQLTGEQIVAMKTADLHHEELIGQQKLDLAKLNADHQEAFAKVDEADRDSARQRQIAVKDQTPARLAYMIIGGFFAVSLAQLIAMMGYPEAVAKIPPQGWLLIGNVSGYLAAEAKAASAFFFGDTAGSKEKTAALVDIAKS